MIIKLQMQSSRDNYIIYFNFEEVYFTQRISVCSLLINGIRSISNKHTNIHGFSTQQ